MRHFTLMPSCAILYRAGKRIFTLSASLRQRNSAYAYSLAVVEVLVHLDTPALLEKYVFLGVDFNASLVINRSFFSAEELIVRPVPEATQAIGDRRALSEHSPCCAASVLLPKESNFLFNPRHLDFGQLASRDHTRSASVLISHGDSSREYLLIGRAAPYCRTNHVTTATSAQTG